MRGWRRRLSRCFEDRPSPTPGLGSPTAHSDSTRSLPTCGTSLSRPAGHGRRSSSDTGRICSRGRRPSWTQRSSAGPPRSGRRGSPTSRSSALTRRRRRSRGVTRTCLMGGFSFGLQRPLPAPCPPTPLRRAPGRDGGLGAADRGRGQGMTSGSAPDAAASLCGVEPAMSSFVTSRRPSPDVIRLRPSA